MKLVGLFLLAAFAIISITKAELKDDIKDLVNLVSKPKIVAIAGKHMIFDKEFRKFKKFITSDEFNTVKKQLSEHPKVLAAAYYLKQKGANIKLSQNMDIILALDEFNKKYNSMQARSVKSFFEDVFKALPRSKLSSAMKEKMTSSPQFKIAVDAILTNEFRDLVNDIKSDPELASGPLKTLSDKGVKIDQIINYAFEIVSWAQ